MSTMDLNRKGITWVGNFFQKLEAVCQEVDDIVSKVALILFYLFPQALPYFSFWCSLTNPLMRLAFSLFSLDVIWLSCV